MFSILSCQNLSREVAGAENLYIGVRGVLLTVQNLQALLQSRIGHPAFRPGQEEIVRHIVEAGDALVVMPTGAGKSLCYQLPAIALTGRERGIAVVVSPLIALMKDQVEGLQKKGVKATLINSTLMSAYTRAPPTRG